MLSLLTIVYIGSISVPLYEGNLLICVHCFIAMKLIACSGFNVSAYEAFL